MASSLERLSFLVCIPAMIALSPVCAGSPGAEAPLRDLDCFLIQMHTHGHSNHNGSDHPASMEWHSSEAKANGFDVIWWTDHAKIFEDYGGISIDFRSAYLDSDSTSLVFADARPRELSRIYVDRPETGCRLDLHEERLIIFLESEPGIEDFRKTTLVLGSERGRVHTVDFCRPVASGLTLTSWLEIDGLDHDTYLRFGFDCSFHPEGQHHVLFNAVGREPQDPLVMRDTAVVYEIEVGTSPQAISLDLEEALMLLSDGDDNVLSSCFIEIGARNGKSISVVFDSLTFQSTKPSGENQFKTVESLAMRYSTAYGVNQYTGVEIGLLHTPQHPHMNAYLPDSTLDYGSISLDQGMMRGLWVEEVHKRGGLVSLNHPFGASLRPRRTEVPNRADTLSIRELSSRGSTVEESEFWRVADPILEDAGLGADILEVGYLFRGKGSLKDHLRLWDIALANGIRLVGNGVSDSHGGYWGIDMMPNPFACWVWAESKDADCLLRAIKAGRVVFGDPFLWQGDFAFGIGEAMMGDTIFVGSGDMINGWIYMEPKRNDVEIRLVQVKMEKARELNVMRNEPIEAESDGIPIYTDDSCFVRIEMYQEDGTPLIFTNPVFIMTTE